MPNAIRRLPKRVAVVIRERRYSVLHAGGRCDSVGPVDSFPTSEGPLRIGQENGGNGGLA